MASDGLWDEMNKDQIAKIAYENKSDKAKIISELFNFALLTAANNKKLTVNDLSNLPPGRDRRSIHDDITIICINLAK